MSNSYRYTVNGGAFIDENKLIWWKLARAGSSLGAATAGLAMFLGFAWMLCRF